MSVRSQLRESVSHTHLTQDERARAEAIFASLLSAETAGLPAFESIDRETFWRVLEEAPAPSFGPGLRVMVHALTLLPLARPRYRTRFHLLSKEAQRAFLAELAEDERYPLRQLVTTMKMLAVFAYFDDEKVRARFNVTPEAER